MVTGPHAFLEGPRHASVVDLARKVARVAGTPVLIQGPPGSGAGELARYLHGMGATAGEPFVEIRCRGIASRDLHAEIFGGVTPAPATTALARAGRGTLFIEEIGLLGTESQTLLGALLDQARAAARDVTSAFAPGRVVAATSLDLARAVQERRFRADLLERLSLVTLVLPSLRDHDSDVAALAERLIEDACRRTGRPATRLTEEAQQKLRGHGWPGDRRELELVIERALIVGAGTTLDAATIVFSEPCLVTEGRDGPARTFVVQSAEDGPPNSLQDVERAYVVWMLRRARGNRTAASRMLGISYPTLMKKILDYGIDYRALAAGKSRA